MYSLSIRYLTQLFYPSPISTINVSINQSVCTLYHRPTYLSALSIIYQSTISIYQCSHPSSIYPYIYPSIEPSSIMSIYPPIQSSSIMSLYPSVSTTYLSSISTINLCNLPSIHLSVSTTYLSICHLPIYINLCIYLSSIHVSTSPICLSLYLSMRLQLWFSTGDDHAPQRMYDKACRHFLLSELGQGGAPDTSWEETRDVAPHPTTHRTDLPPPQRITQPLNIRGSKVKTL